MKIGVIGVGRLGICFALLLEKAGYQVLGSDLREDYVRNLNQKKIITNEPYVQELLAASTNINFVVGNDQVISKCDVIYVMVATPSTLDGSYDITAVNSVIDDLTNGIYDITDKTIVIGCTVNPGDCQKIQDRVRSFGAHVLYNPEFIAQGSIISDLQKADLVLVGGENQDLMARYALVYNDIQTTTPNVHLMSLTAAEVTKIAVNCFLTTKISYANLVGEVLIKNGLEKDVSKVLTAIGSDTRVGSKYMKFGFGFGGPCLPRDNRAFGNYTRSNGIDFNLGKTVDEFNKAHLKFLVDYVIEKNSDNLPFYFDYITYKSGTDIMDESQQYQLCLALLNLGHRVVIRDDEKLPNRIKEELLTSYNKLVAFVDSGSDSDHYRIL
jgi:nucleotide sugar dehydrogenase